MDIKKRNFLRGRLRAGTHAPARPPWAVAPESLFTERCTRCGDCVRACPRQVLKTGDGGFPIIDFALAGCSLCGDCVRACKTAALAPAEIPAPFPWRVKVSDACLTRHGVECRLCGDTCDTRALRFERAPGGIAQLHIELDLCTGCGDCIAICPVKALSVA